MGWFKSDKEEEEKIDKFEKLNMECVFQFWETFDELKEKRFYCSLTKMGHMFECDEKMKKICPLWNIWKRVER